MANYSNRAGRISIELNNDGARDQTYGHGVSLRLSDGWNDECESQCWICSVEDLRDLQYLIVRAIATAEAAKT